MRWRCNVVGRRGFKTAAFLQFQSQRFRDTKLCTGSCKSSHDVHMPNQDLTKTVTLLWYKQCSEIPSVAVPTSQMFIPLSWRGINGTRAKGTTDLQQFPAPSSGCCPCFDCSRLQEKCYKRRGPLNNYRSFPSPFRATWRQTQLPAASWIWARLSRILADARLFFRERRTHKHKQICGIVPGLGGCQKFVHVFFGSFLMGEKKTHKQSSPQNPGTIRWTFCLSVFSLCIFFAP